MLQFTIIYVYVYWYGKMSKMLISEEIVTKQYAVLFCGYFSFNVHRTHKTVLLPRASNPCSQTV
jgi:hypothetical protein